VAVKNESFADLPARRALVGSLLRGLGTSLCYLLIAFAIHVTFARLLTPANFGDYMIALNALSLGALVAAFGSKISAPRYIPNYAVEEDWARVSGFLRFFVGLMLAASLVIAVVMWLGEYILNGLGRSATARDLHPIAVAALAIPIYALAQVLAAVLRSFGAETMAFVPNKVVAPALTLVFTAALVWRGVTVTDWLLVLMVAAAAGVSALLQIVVFLWRGHGFVLAHKAAFEPREWLRFSVPVMVTGLMAELVKSVDLIMLEVLAPSEASVGLYGAANGVVWVILIVLTASVVIMSPFMGVAAGTDDRRYMQRIYTFHSAYLVLMCTLTTVLLIVFARPILSLFGHAYLAAETPYIVLAVGYCLFGILGVSRSYLQFTKRNDLSMIALAVGVVVNIVLNVVLIPRYGMTGAAVSTLASLFATALLETILLYRATGLLPFVPAGRDGTRAQAA